MEKFFKLKENKTDLSTELMAGITTFFAMAYIIFVNPSMLSLAGTADNPMPTGAIFLATIIASAVGTLVMGLFANVPYAQAPGMGLNAFFTFTVSTIKIITSLLCMQVDCPMYVVHQPLFPSCSESISQHIYNISDKI